MSEQLDVVAIGNAIVDVIAQVDDAFLAAHAADKGAMTLIDAERAVTLYKAMPSGREVSGGSAANTVAGLAALGTKTGFVGRVRDDQLGRIFAHDIRAVGAEYAGPFAPDEGAEETARCLVLVTPDGERTMNTYLGVSSGLGPDDIDAGMLARAAWVYLEGYLFDSPASKEAYARAIDAVKAAGGKIAFTVSDAFCVARHRGDMKALIAEHVDLLFANRAELLSLYETEDLEAALTAVGRDVAMAAVTLSEEGAVVVVGAERHAVPADPVAVIDTTGAGDLFAAGFLAGLVSGHTPAECARMGCVAAAEIISHIGARPEADLKARMTAAGL